MPFEVQNTFGKSFLRILFSTKEIADSYPGKTVIALFDFDEAYDDWNRLVKDSDEETDPFKGLAKKLKHPNHYAMLLPVPNSPSLKKQVLDNENKPWGRGVDSHLSIELLFYDEEWEENNRWFRIKPTSCGGELIEFCGNKYNFASSIVKALPKERFEPFRLLLDYVKSKC